MDTRIVTVDTSHREIVDLTDEAAQSIPSGNASGLLNVFVPHATAAVVIVETGSGSEEDLFNAVQRLLPADVRYRHQHGSPGHGAHHLVPALLGSSLTLPVISGRLELGTWQSVVLVDPNPDNPHRTVRFSFIEG